jgi:alpha-beta hydrolase superfamily lysophospholipase
VLDIHHKADRQYKESSAPPPSRPPGPPQRRAVTLPGVLEHPVLTPDGTEIFTQRWTVPEGRERRGSLLLVHGLGEHSGRYAGVARMLNDAGLEVCAYDHRGHGRSAGGRGVLPHADALLDDLRLVFGGLTAEAREAGDAEPPLLLGHSMGGVTAARAATGGWVAPRGLILSSPALRLYLRPPQRALLAVLARVAPDRPSPNGLALQALSHDPETIAAYTSDEHNHDRLTPRLAQFMERAGAAARRDAPSFRIPTLLLVAGADRLIDPAGARQFAAALPAGVGTLRWYDDLYHELFNESEPERSEVLTDLRAWLDAQLQRQKQRAD